MSHPDLAPGFEPRRPALIATAIFVLAMLALCWPMLAGRYLYGSDQLVTGYAFRHFGAEFFKAHGHLPEWNPYIFGGLPYIGAMHGDIFYPAAWLRLIMREDLAMTLAWAIHFVVAGCAMYAFLRALRLGWTGAVVGGVAYQMTGILASLVSPGHDGKLFVSALAPLLFLALLRAIRHGSVAAHAGVALVTGLCLLSPHYQLTYYLLVAGGFWALYLVFLDEDRRPGLRWPVALAAAAGAVGLGIAISAIQAIPFLANMPWGARGTGAGWDYATGFSMPIEELMTTILPEFNGTLSSYWGQNFFKLHTEYLGVVAVILAVLGVTEQGRGRLRWGLLFIGGFFLLVALGRHTPFYRLWYEVMPLMKKVRAPGMAFFLPALVTAVLAGMGADRLERRAVPPRLLIGLLGVLGAIGLLGAIGGLQVVATALAPAETMDRVAANAQALQGGAVRMLLFVLAGGAVAWLMAQGRIRPPAATALLLLAVVGDLWSLNRRFFSWEAPASELFATDPVVSRLQQADRPMRVMNLPGSPTYQGGALMTWDIPQVFGYHGNEIGFYDQLWGGKNIWANVERPTLWDLYAVGWLIVPQPARVGGFHDVVGPVTTRAGAPAYLMQRDTVPPYARVVAAAAKVPDAQLVSTLIDPRFPVRDLVLFPDTASIEVAPLSAGLPARPAVEATVPEWEPGRMKVALQGTLATPAYLVISENWHPDWHATVDGTPVPVVRGNQAMLTVPLPAGAHEVVLAFASPSYRTGKHITLAALVVTLALAIVPVVRRRRDA